jgi:omega-amidase
MLSLTISLVQTDLVWENAEVNRLHIEELLWELEEQTDLIVLPELFSTAFSFSNQLSEPHNLHTFKWMKQMASLKNACILGSYLIKEKGLFYNRCYCVFPDGNYQTYDKRHLFSLSTEKEFCTPGNNQVIFEIKGWKIMPSICYDLRFPVWLRNTNKYDILINIANWPSQRKEAWQSLLQTRSIENQCFTIGVNRIGTDENQLTYNGESTVYCPEGKNLIKLDNKESITTITIKKEHLTQVRNNYPFLNDQDQFKIDI